MPELKEVFAPHLGRNVKFGCLAPLPGAKKFRLNKYLNAGALPAPPASVNYGAAASVSLNNIYGNDVLGDCVIAAGAHVRGVTSGNAGSLVTFTNSQITKMYSDVGGYIPGNPNTDQGCDPVTANNYWMKVGFPDGVKLAGWLALDGRNKNELMLATYLFENLTFALNLPDAYTNPMPSRNGFVWDVAGSPDTRSGHMVMSYSYGPSGVTIDTWGLQGSFTWGAIAKYCIETAGGDVYVLLSPDMVNKAIGKAPNGLDWGALVSDFNSLGGSVPTPAPIPVPPSPIPVPPTPVPVPVPPAGKVTLQQVIGALQTTENQLKQQYKQIGASILNLAAKNITPLFNSSTVEVDQIV